MYVIRWSQNPTILGSMSKDLGRMVMPRHLALTAHHLPEVFQPWAENLVEDSKNSETQKQPEDYASPPHPENTILAGTVTVCQQCQLHPRRQTSLKNRSAESILSVISSYPHPLPSKLRERLKGEAETQTNGAGGVRLQTTTGQPQPVKN